MIAIMWQFEVKRGRESDFEELYGIEGEWTAMNRHARSYLGTSFLRDQNRWTRAESRPYPELTAPTTEPADAGGILLWLGIALFVALGREPNIEYVDMPPAIRNQYQYFTQAEVANLQRAGYNAGFAPLEESVRRYVTQFLDREDRYR